MLEKGRTAEGCAALEARLTQMAQPPPKALILAGRTRLKLGDPKAAAEWFELFRDLFPNRHEGLVGLAECAEKAGQHRMALDYWRAIRAEFGDMEGPAWHRRVQKNLFALGLYDELNREISKEFSSSVESRRYLELTTNSGNWDCHSLAYDHILVVTYGRSGSTLLQGLLNSIPGTLVRGENGNVFSTFFEIFRHMHTMRLKHANAFTANRPWFGISEISDSTLIEALRPTARALLLGDLVSESSLVCLGFKEVRYDELGDNLADYLDFLQELFPKAEVIFNTRDLSATCQSGWWKDRDPSAVHAHLSEVEKQFFDYAAGRSNCFQIRYEDVVGKSQVLRDLFVFLGAEYDENRVDAVLSQPHSYDPTQPHGTTTLQAN